MAVLTDPRSRVSRALAQTTTINPVQTYGTIIGTSAALTTLAEPAGVSALTVTLDARSGRPRDFASIKSTTPSEVYV